MLAGAPYIPADPELRSDKLRARRLQDDFNRLRAGSVASQRRILDELLGEFGSGSEIRPPFYCSYGYQTRIGVDVFANVGLVALDVAVITIGDHVQIGPSVQLLTPTHPLEADARRAKWESAKPITIRSNAWLGGGVIVLPGVTIGDNAVVGAGAVVTHDVPANVVAVGNPARVIRSV
jgi:maltose O-acetyltransferase